jgi:DNA helicase-2/ATP-dependent DNA helicase PcrA
MSDESVARALRSMAPLAVVEAPGGCGKTYQGANYAREIACGLKRGRVLILAHTHAACDVFAARTENERERIDIRTVDSLINQIASAYHRCLNLPKDTGAWARSRETGYIELASMVAHLLRVSSVIARSLAERYPIIICDEHQDASVDQHSVVMACHNAGASVRIFYDPMQSIFGGKDPTEAAERERCWAKMKQSAHIIEELDYPHRWSNDSEQLGRWILSARATLRDGGKIDLSGELPRGISVIFAENQSQKWNGLQWAKEDSAPIYKLERQTPSLLVLAAQNATVSALRGLFGRRLPIWEGHVRDNLSILIREIQKHSEDCQKIAAACIAFLESVTTGFSTSAYGKALLAEVVTGCNAKRRGKPATLQSLGRLILEQPNHRGASKFLAEVHRLTCSDPAFRNIRIDRQLEFFDAIKLGDFADANDGFAEIARRRSFARLSVPRKAISTIHKAKGLEFANVLIIRCDGGQFKDDRASRCLLYVGISRAMKSLTLVVSRKSPCPLLAL